MLALTHSLLRSPFTLFLPPQSDVADMLAVSRRATLIVFVFGAYYSNRLVAQLDAPAEVRFVTTSAISHWCQTFATAWCAFLQNVFSRIICIEILSIHIHFAISRTCGVIFS